MPRSIAETVRFARPNPKQVDNGFLVKLASVTANTGAPSPTKKIANCGKPDAHTRRRIGPRSAAPWRALPWAGPGAAPCNGRAARGSGHICPMGEVPPVVTYRVVDGPAYLLAWRRRPDRSWWALLTWVSRAGDGHRHHQCWVPADEIEPIPGQDYSAVPRRTPSAPEPSDPTDPRDPRHGDRAGDRAVIEQRLHRDEPDF